jgi:hypothetical protein
VAVVVVFEGPTITQEKYEDAVRRLTGGKSRFESASDWPNGGEGLLMHAAGQGSSRFRVVDVWESEEAFGRFAETLGPILQEIGVEEPPQVYPAHTFISS